MLNRYKKYKETIIYIVFIVVVITWLFVRIKPETLKFIELKKEINQKNIQITELERNLSTAKAKFETVQKQEVKTTKKIVRPEVAGLDAESSIAIIFDDIIEMARFNNIKIHSIQYVYNPETDPFVIAASIEYNVCQLEMKVITDYIDFENFMQDLYKYPFIVIRK